MKGKVFLAVNCAAEHAGSMQQFTVNKNIILYFTMGLQIYFLFYQLGLLDTFPNTTLLKGLISIR